MTSNEKWAEAPGSTLFVILPYCFQKVIDFITSGFYQKEIAASSLKMWNVYSEDCGYCFISLLGKISEDKARTKDLTTDKLNIGLNSSLFFKAGDTLGDFIRRSQRLAKFI